MSKPFHRMEEGREAEYECEEAIAEILGVQLLGISFDSYDGSFEIYPWEDVADVAPTKEQHDRILALGCMRYWINFPDGTQRYGMGARSSANGESRWQRHNSYRDEQRNAADRLTRAERALRQIAAMDPQALRADDLGRAARFAREALASSPVAADTMGDAWQPIESAPVGEEFLACIEVTNIASSMKWWEQHVLYRDDEDGSIGADHHKGWDIEDYHAWRPLPPPAAATTEGKPDA